MIVDEQVFGGGGDLAALMRSLDWSRTPLGAAAGWPQSLRTALSICLESRFPMLIWWGADLAMLYNDAYRPMLGTTKHPRALGAPGRAIWPEIWDVIGPMLEGVLVRGEATWSNDQLLTLDRNGYLEECYFTFSYSPIRDESGGVGGVFTAVTETTARVLGERRLATLRDLASRTADAVSAEAACAIAAEVLAENPADLPFAVLYLLDEAGRRASLAGCAGVRSGAPAAPATFDLAAGDAGSWPLGAAVRGERALLVADLAARYADLPGGPWPDPPSSALILPIGQAGQELPAGLLVAGISSRRALDDDYRGFLGLVAGHIATAVGDARVHEAQRKRAEALAELDRAKTVFFSNVSHEFRTPLTLMLGPIEALLAEMPDQAPAQWLEQLEAVHRNGLRLLRLVNTLLDFSRIEAGRTRATFEPADLAQLTTELAGVFRSAIERAGLRLVVECPPLPEPVYVDPDMWEKIVLNLLSNAFKFTFEGEIGVALRYAGDRVELEVRDTGTGISPEEQSHIFERFHSVREARSRTHEGSGIGLALVQELVRLHGGAVRVESTLGAGATFTVAIPTGTAHLPADRVAAPRQRSAGASAGLYVEEALRWLPPKETGDWRLEASEDSATGIALDDAMAQAPSPKPQASNSKPRILLADDNADMRDYIVRLLGQRFAVRAVGDGRAALELARSRQPDLIVADVMMPGLDGFELLRELRADERTQTIPVLLLSARAGEDAAVEGLAAGADDYLIKPFSARELQARVEAHLALARMRSASAEREQLARRAAERAADQAARLLAVTAALADIRTPAEVCAIVVEHALAGLCASAGAVALNDQQDTPALVYAAGLSAADAAMPAALAQAARSGEASWPGALAEQAAGGARAAVCDAGDPSGWAALPLLVDGGPIGALGLCFAGQRALDEPDRAFLAALAQHGAQAIDRARLHEAERRVRAALEMAERRATFLAEAGALLSASLDEHATLARLARLAVPFLADVCVVGLLDSGSGLRVAVAHVDPSKEPALEQLAQDYSLLEHMPHLLRRALETGQPVLEPNIDEAAIAEPQHLALLREVGLRGSAMVVPLSARGRLLGTISFWPTVSERRYTSADLVLAEDLARRAATAIENARLYREAQETATHEQRHASLLRMLADAARAITSTLALDDLLRVITEQAAAIIGAHQAITSTTVDQNWAQAISTVVLSEKYAAWRGYNARPDGNGIYALVCRENRPLRLSHAELEAHPDWHSFGAEAGRHPPLRGWLAAPLIGSTGQNLGLIQLSDKRAGEFTAEDESILVQLAQLASIAIENARLYRESQAAVRSRDDVLSVVSHDLKNPLGVIKGYAQQLQRRVRRLGVPEPDRLLDGLAKIDDAGSKMAALLNDVLDTARLQAGQPLPLDVQPTDIVALARQVVAEQQQTTDQHAIQLSAERAELIGMCDAARMERTLANLVSNAIKYSPRGGDIAVAIATERQGGDEWAVLSVQDHGMGIPSADLPYIFDRFQRGSNVGDQIEGTGLGLASARQIVEQHHGTIDVSSAEGQGTCFTIRLPLGEAR